MYLLYSLPLTNVEVVAKIVFVPCVKVLLIIMHSDFGDVILTVWLEVWNMLVPLCETFKCWLHGKDVAAAQAVLCVCADLHYTAGTVLLQGRIAS